MTNYHRGLRIPSYDVKLSSATAATNQTAKPATFNTTRQATLSMKLLYLASMILTSRY